MTPPPPSPTNGTNDNGDHEITEEQTDGNAGFATGCANLDAFADLVNKEAYWVPSEICNETNLAKRVDLLKRFIKVCLNSCLNWTHENMET